MMERFKQAVGAVWGWMLAAFAGLVALFGILFYRERKIRMAAESRRDADVAGAKAEVLERQAQSNQAVVIPAISKAEAEIEQSITETKRSAEAKLKEGGSDGAKELVEQFRRAGY